MRAALVLALLLALAGCADPGRDGAGHGPEAGPPALGSPFRLDCDPDCGRLTDLDGSSGLLGEPDVAVDAADPARMAIVAQTTRPAPVVDGPGAALNHFVLFVTQDGGGTWTERAWPSVAGTQGDLPPLRIVSDPSVAFASSRLVVAGMVTDGTGYDPFVAVSGDLGATWSTVQGFEATRFPDRPWVEAHGDSIVLVWSNLVEEATFGPPGWAWSRDGGATWDAGLADLPGTDCRGTLVRPVVDAHGFTFGCTGYRDGRFDGGRVLRWEDGVGFAPVLALGPQHADLHGIAERPDGRWLLTGNSEAFGLLHSGTEGPPVPLDDLLAIEDGWFGRQYTAFEADGNGAFHLLLREIVSDATGQRYGRVAYASWSPEQGVGEERVLLDDLEGAVASPLVKQTTLLVDDYHDIAFEAGRGLAAWGGDGAIHWATLSPPA